MDLRKPDFKQLSRDEAKQAAERFGWMYMIRIVDSTGRIHCNYWKKNVRGYTDSNWHPLGGELLQSIEPLLIQNSLLSPRHKIQGHSQKAVSCIKNSLATPKLPFRFQVARVHWDGREYSDVEIAVDFEVARDTDRIRNDGIVKWLKRLVGGGTPVQVIARRESEIMSLTDFQLSWNRPT